MVVQIILAALHLAAQICSELHPDYSISRPIPDLFIQPRLRRRNNSFQMLDCRPWVDLSFSLLQHQSQMTNLFPSPIDTPKPCSHYRTTKTKAWKHQAFIHLSLILNCMLACQKRTHMAFAVDIAQPKARHPQKLTIHFIIQASGRAGRDCMHGTYFFLVLHAD